MQVPARRRPMNFKPLILDIDRPKICGHCQQASKGQYVKSEDGLRQKFYCNPCIDRGKAVVPNGKTADVRAG